MPIAHVGTISTEDARTIRVVPWDKSQIKSIEEAVRKADIGLSVTADGEGLRVIFPELTSERRAQVIKLLGDKHEEARVSLRKVREEILGEWKRAAADGDMSEDELYKAKEDLQKLIDKTNARFDDMAMTKQKEISG
jgi:ribosome recycling factor